MSPRTVLRSMKAAQMRITFNPRSIRTPCRFSGKGEVSRQGGASRLAAPARPFGGVPDRGKCALSASLDSGNEGDPMEGRRAGEWQHAPDFSKPG